MCPHSPWVTYLAYCTCPTSGSSQTLLNNRTSSTRFAGLLEYRRAEIATPLPSSDTLVRHAHRPSKLHQTVYHGVAGMRSSVENGRTHAPSHPDRPPLSLGILLGFWSLPCDPPCTLLGGIGEGAGLPDSDGSKITRLGWLADSHVGCHTLHQGIIWIGIMHQVDYNCGREDQKIKGSAVAYEHTVSGPTGLGWPGLTLDLILARGCAFLYNCNLCSSYAELTSYCVTARAF
jgi:hypothetical protein